jgi:hypothetical protein
MGAFNNKGPFELRSRFRDSYGFFLLRFAQRFFMASDGRFLPAGVIPPPDIKRLGLTSCRKAPRTMIVES